MTVIDIVPLHILLADVDLYIWPMH